MRTRSKRKLEEEDKDDNEDETRRPNKKQKIIHKSSSDSDSDPDYDPLDDLDNDSFIVPDTFIEYENGIEENPTFKTRSVKIDDVDIEKYQGDVDRLINEFNKKDINEYTIIKSDLSFQDKIECYELLRILKNTRIFEGESHSWVELRNKLYNKVVKSKPFTQEDYNEAERLRGLIVSDLSLEQRILRSNHPDNIKSRIYEKYQYMKNLPEDDETRGKYEEWINKCLALPSEVIELTTLYKDCTEMLLSVRGNMDKGLYGQDLVKERIMEVLTAMWTNPDRTRNTIVFLGNPGVGKTALARLLADSIGLPFYQISFGGAKDSSIIKGHSLTYISSKPGEIVEGLIQMGIKNGILYLDELDKILNSVNGREVANSLLHILDYSQNLEFKDNYLHGIPIDLSKLIIVISINTLESINSILRDRLPIVSFNDYTLDDKVNIGTYHLTPKIISNLGIPKDSVKFDRSSIAHIIEKSNIFEHGVRQLERNISTIFERINVLIQINKSNNRNKSKVKLSYTIPNFKLPLKLNKGVIDSLFEEYIYEDT